jgi:hypothetical protein
VKKLAQRVLEQIKYLDYMTKYWAATPSLAGMCFDSYTCRVGHELVEEHAD